MIKISIEKSTREFRPGENVSGVVDWDDLEPETKRIETRLIWYTEGNGDQDFDVAGCESTENPSPTGRRPFQFVAPTRPYSFSGKLISLIWAIEVVKFPSRDCERETLTISPTGQEVILDQSFEQTSTNPRNTE